MHYHSPNTRKRSLPMFKSIIISSLLLASQVFGDDYHGGPCLEGQCETSQKTCDSVNHSKLLVCGSNSIHCGIPFGDTYWYLDRTCGYCCQTLTSNSPYCVDSEADCLRDKRNQFNY